MKKIITSIIFIMIFILYCNKTCQAVDGILPSFNSLVQDLGNDAVNILSGQPIRDNEYWLNGKTNIGQGGNRTYKISETDIFGKSGTNAYCISAGQGMGKNPNDTYELKNCIIIGPKGVYLGATGETGMYMKGKLYFSSWEDIKQNTDVGEKAVESAKKLHYILKAGDSYGTSSHGTYMYEIKKGNTTFRDNSSERQYAIWKNIDPLLKLLKENCDWDSKIGQFNSKANPMHSGLGDKLYNEANQNYNNNIQGYVVMWLFQSTGNNNKVFYQDIMLGGELKSKTVISNSSITIEKKNNNGETMKGVQFALAMKEDDGLYHFQNLYSTSSGGRVTFYNLKQGKSYKIYEYSTLDGYSLDPNDITITKSGGSTYKATSESFYASNGTFTSPRCIEVTIPSGATVNYTYTVKNKKIGSITLKKRIAQGGGVLSGVAFDLIEGHYESGSYNGKTYWTDSNGEISITGLKLNQEYTLRETNFKSNKNTYLMNTGQLVYVKLTDSNPNQEINVWNNQYGGLEIEKINKNNGNKLKGVKFKLYKYNTANKTLDWKYDLGPTNANGVTISEANKTEPYNYQGSISINSTNYSIKVGTYYLFECENPNEGYNLEYQGREAISGLNSNYNGKTYIPGMGAYMGTVTIKAGKIEKKEIKNEPFADVYLYKYKENSSNNELTRIIEEGAGFKLYQGGKAISLRNPTNSGETTEFFSKKTASGEFTIVNIKRIPKGTYELYETTFPSDIEPTIQPGYDKDKKAVKIATIAVDSLGNTTCVLVQDNKTIKYKDGNFKYRSYSITDKAPKKQEMVNIFVTNRKYMKISGYVWEDIGSSTKEPENGNNKYKENLNELDTRIKGIKVRLLNKNVTGTVEETETNQNGDYKFEKLLVAAYVKEGIYRIEFDYSSYSKVADRNTYWEEGKYLYRPVEPLVGEKNGSKALTKAILPKTDETMIQSGGYYYKAYTGYGKENFNIADKDANTYYNSISEVLDFIKSGSIKKTEWIYNDGNEQIPTLHYMNLGIRQMVKPTYTISQNIAYAKLEINGYEYKYVYGESGNGEYKYYQTPRVKWQSKENIEVYTREIFPSDAYLAHTNGNIKLTIVYRIDITNTTLTDITGVYKEHNLVIDKSNLKNYFDETRYKLSKDDDEETTGKWGEVEDGTNYTRYQEKIKIEKGKTKSIYIAFEVKNDVIAELLNNPNGTIEEKPTEVRAIAYHEYTRYDYGWSRLPEDENEDTRRIWRYYVVDNYKNNSYGVPGKVDGKEGKLHNSIPETKVDSAPYLAIKLSDTNRTIKGKVFKDNNVREETNEVVGNGKIDNNESKVTGVKIDLLNSNGSYAMLYTKNDGEYYTTVDLSNNLKKSIEIKSSESDGTYEIKGITPGEYFIQFTYGDGNQKIVDTEGNEISVNSNDYKSTIVQYKYTGSAYDGYTYDGKDIRNKDKEYTWYLYNDGEEYNMAVDKEINKDSFEYDQEIDLTTYIEKNTQVYASTPKMSVPIEFTISKEGKVTEPIPIAEHMNFGIIERPKINLEIDKEVSNIKLTLQNGQVLIDGNPTQNIPYVANLDTKWSNTGSHYAKVEIDSQYIYGSTLEIKYLLTIKNKSDVTYTGEGYYKYGYTPNIDGNVKEAKIDIKELLEYLDTNLKFKSSDMKSDKKLTEDFTKDFTNNASYSNALKSLYDNEGKEREFKEIQIIDDTRTNLNIPNISTENTFQIYTSINNPNRTDKKTSTTVEVVAERILSTQDDNLDYESYAQISTVTIAKNTYKDPTGVLNLSSLDGKNYYKDIPYDSAKTIVSPSTGFERNKKYIISAVVLIISLIGIVVCIRKIRR